MAIPGQSFVLNANSSNYGSVFIILKPFHERQGAELSGEAILQRSAHASAQEVPEARVLVFGAPAVRGLGNAGGFKLMVEATGDVDYDALQAQADNLAAKGNQQPGLVGLFDGFRARTPQLYVDVDREKVKTMGVALNDVFDALQAYLGSYYVNDFNRFGRTWQVNIQADAPLPHGRGGRQAAQGAQRRRRHGAAGGGGRGARLRRAGADHPLQHVPGGPDHRRLPARREHRRRPGDDGAPGGPGRCRSNMTYEWTELSYLQKQASKVEQFRDLQQNPLSAFVLGSVLVFFVLAGLYEGWSLPLAVILVVPMCVLCALAGVAVRGLDNNLFTQIGFVVLIGLACKNAILIVEFARDRQQEGASRFDAAVEAARGAAAADRDDDVVLHPHGAAVLRLGRRRGDAPLGGHGHAVGRLRRDAVRPLPDAGVLLRHPRPCPDGPRAGRRRDRWVVPRTGRRRLFPWRPRTA